VRTVVVTTGGGGPAIVVAEEMPVPETIITLGVGGCNFACEVVPRVLDDTVRVNITGTLVTL